MKTIPGSGRAALAIAGALAAAGCGRSAQARFYQLDPLRGPDAVVAAAARQASVVVAVGPVQLPDYLDRSQIVTRSGRNELKLAEFERWAGSLEEDVTRVLAEDLAAQLPPERFFVVRWAPLLESRLPNATRVEVRVERFEGAPGGEVLLRAQWSLVARTKGVVFRTESAIIEPVGDESYAALVAAMSRATAKLGDEIVATILGMPPASEVSGDP